MSCSEHRKPDQKRTQCLTRGGEHGIALDDFDARQLCKPELDLLHFCFRRKLQQEGRDPVEHQVGRADFCMLRGLDWKHLGILPLRRRSGRRSRCAAERNNIGESAEAQEIGLV
jgi:hypothetical protein